METNCRVLVTAMSRTLMGHFVEEFLVALAEIRQVIESTGIGHSTYIHMLVIQHLVGFNQSEIADICVRREVGERFQFSIKH